MNKKNLKSNAILISIYRTIQASGAYFRFRVISFIRDAFSFVVDLVSYKNDNKNFKFKTIYPCLTDKTSETPLDPVYFFQDTWAAKKIFEIKPRKHVDVGSNAKTVGLISQFVPTTMVDIRPLPLRLKGLNFIKGSILNLPFEDDSLESISSLCVVEHIGLGRYGDELNSFGSEESTLELKRVTKQGGYILFSVPVDRENGVFFNATRTFTRDYILELFRDCELIEEMYIYGTETQSQYKPEFGTGCYLFKKVK